MNFEDFTVVGHRGAMAHAQENTLHSFRLAEEVGADEIELDIRLSSDGQVFILHDPTAERVAAEPQGPALELAATLTLEELQALELADGSCIPTLEQALDESMVSLQVEIKAIEAVSPAAEILRRRPEDARRVQFTGFDSAALRAARDVAPQIRRGLIFGPAAELVDEPGQLCALAKELELTYVHLHFNALRPGLVELLREEGFGVFVWPLRGIEDLRRAMEIGAAGGCADDPALARRWMRQLDAPRVMASAAQGG